MTTTFTASAASAGHDHAHEEASLLIGSRWATPDAPGGRTVISYSFGTRGASYAPEEADFSATLAEFSDADKQTTRDVLHSIEAVCNVEFVEVADSGAGHGVLRYAYSQQPTALGHAGYAFYPSSADVGGDIWIGKAQAAAEWSHYRPGLILHETLHALGLKHPFEGADTLASADNIIPNTAMSYSAIAGSTSGALSRYPQEPMPLDIKALQALYGEATHNEGNTTYRLADDSFQGNFRALWDSSGSDTLDASGIAAGVVLDLNPGMRSDIGLAVQAFSYAGAATSHTTYTRTLAIAEGTVIENAVGTAHDDVIRGNSANNRIDGGDGLDTVIYQGARSDFSIRQQGDAHVLADRSGREGTDTLRQVERIEFADRCVALDLDGNAGVAARILGAVAGKAAVQNAAHVGRVLGLLDNGMSRSDVADYVIDAALGTPHTHQSFVALLYGNVAGTAPGAAELAYYTQLLDSGQASQSSLALLAADSTGNAARIDLTGLAATGLEYLPQA